MDKREEYERKINSLDYVYRMLKEKGQPIHYSEILDEVYAKFFSHEGDAIRAKARFYTWMNLDPRFAGMGKGYWGLRQWAPAKGSRRLPLLSLLHKTVEYDDSSPKTLRKVGEDEFYPEEEFIPEEEPLLDADEFPGEE